VNFIAGLCLLFAPWVLGFTAETHAAWNAWIVGVVVALVALGALFAFSEWEEWVNLVLGLWAIISPWALGFTGVSAAAMTHIILGLIVAILAAVEIWFTHNRPLSTA
jgi:SPW repeat-containing protein